MKLFEVTSNLFPSAPTIHLIDITESISIFKHRKLSWLRFDNKSTNRLPNKQLFTSSMVAIVSSFLHNERLITELFTITDQYHFCSIKIHSYWIFVALKLVDRQKCRSVMTFLFTLRSISRTHRSETRINPNSCCRTEIEWSDQPVCRPRAPSLVRRSEWKRIRL